MTRTRTFQGLAPEEPRPRLDSESPKSGIRLVQPPLRVPRPVRQSSIPPSSVAPTPPSVPAPIPPPPPSRRAAVKPRGDRAHVTLLPPAPPEPEAPGPAPSKPARAIPALTIPALAPAHERSAPTPSPIQFRSLITTAQDWMLVKPPPPISPTFGMALRTSLHSLPAFLPPQELLGDVPPVTTDRASAGRVSDAETEVVRSRRAIERRVRFAMAMAGFTLAFLAALVVIAFARG